MATHDIWRAREVADRILVLVRGRLAVELDPQSMSADDVERRFFLEAEAV
jgi:ABC-2 type transport system ATP-binding protein